VVCKPKNPFITAPAPPPLPSAQTAIYRQYRSLRPQWFRVCNCSLGHQDVVGLKGHGLASRSILRFFDSLLAPAFAFDVGPDPDSTQGSRRALAPSGRACRNHHAICLPGERSADRRASSVSSEAPLPTAMDGVQGVGAPCAALLRSSRKADVQAATLFLIAPISAVSMAPPAPPAITWEIMPPILRLPDCAAATTEGSNKVTI
jgi:hypothetical protein